MPSNGIFVFGSNDRGVHGLGAAKTAVDEFGAIRNQSSGQQGKAFAVRTKMYQDNSLTKYNDLTIENKKAMDKMTVEDLNALRLAALSNPNTKYYVTEIGTKLAGRTVDQMRQFFQRMNDKFGIPTNIILPQSFDVRIKTSTAEPVKKQSITVPYTPKGKEMQVYTVIGSQIFNKDNQEVFKEDSVDRNKIFANVAIKTGRAVVVPHKGVDYIVNTKNQVISSVTGKIMQWDENNGNLRAILAEATKKFTPVGADILMREIDDIYNKKSVKDVSLDEYRTQAQDFIKKLSAAGLSKPAILEQLNCL
jgi:hypothetical protein